MRPVHHLDSLRGNHPYVSPACNYIPLIKQAIDKQKSSADIFLQGQNECLDRLRVANRLVHEDGKKRARKSLLNFILGIASFSALLYLLCSLADAFSF